MADGITHQKSNQKLILILLVLYVILFGILFGMFNISILYYLIFAFSGIIFGYINGPDLDQPGTTINETEVAVKLYYFLRKQLKVNYTIANFIKQSIINTKKIL